MSKMLADLRDAIVGRMDESYDLIYVDYRDSLTGEQVDAIVRHDFEALWESFAEWESEARWEGARYVLDELTREVLGEWRAEAETEAEHEWVEGIESDWEMSDEWDEARFALEDRESGAWLRQLVDQTPDIYIRVPIGSELYLTGNADDDAVDDVMANLNLTDTPELREVVRGILPEAGEGYAVPFLFASVSVASIFDLSSDDEADVVITGGSLLLENPYQGSGWNDDLPEGMSLTVKRSALRTDTDAPGYSWDDVCGLVHGAWPATVVVAA